MSSKNNLAKQVLAIVLAAMLMVTMLPLTPLVPEENKTAYADGNVFRITSDKETDTEYATSSEIYEKYGNGKSYAGCETISITLLQDWTETFTYISFSYADSVGFFTENATINFDLNGHVLTLSGGSSSIRVRNGNSLTITDSKGGGKIIRNADGGRFFYLENATLNIQGGTFENACEDLIYINSPSNVNISGRAFRTTSQDGRLICAGGSSSTLQVTGGTFDDAVIYLNDKSGPLSQYVSSGYHVETLTSGAAFEAGYRYQVVEGAPVAEPTSSEWYYITFDGQYTTLEGWGDMPEEIVVTIEGGLNDGNVVSARMENDKLSFPYESEKYKITFTCDNKAYTMHANCKTKEVQFTTDTSYLEDVISEMKELKDSDFSTGVVPKIVQSGFSAGVVVSEASKKVFAEAIPDENYKPSEIQDQIDVDEAANSLKRAYNAYLSSLDAPLLTVSGESIVAVDYGQDYDYVKNISIEYAEGIYAAPSAGLIQEFSGSLPAGNKVYTFFTKADICGQEKNSVVYYGTVDSLLTWANSKLSEDKRLSGLSDPEAIVNGYFAAIKPQGGGGHKEDPDPQPQPEPKDITDFVVFTVNDDTVSWESKDPAVKIERVSFTAGKNENGSYIPLPKRAASFRVPSYDDYTIKMLLRTGDVVKTYYYTVEDNCLDPSEIDDCPLVQAYNGAVGVYARSFYTEVSFVAYTEGTGFSGIGDALSEELGDNPTAKVYYVKDGAILDNSAFEKGKTYTFFFLLDDSEESMFKITF